MRKSILAALLAALPSTALAGGIERTPQSMEILFAPDRTLELSFGAVRPRASGTSPLTPGTGSGNVFRNYLQPGLAVKWPLTDRLDGALIFDRPFGARTRYADGTGYFLSGSSADITSEALTGVLRYRLEGGFAVYGGIRLQQLRGEARVRTLTGLDYRLDAPTSREAGYLVGVSWERPDIAARVALTYNSAIRHSFAATEQTAPLPAQPASFRSTTPESINLEFQTGIAPDTLLFGSVRWARWSRFEIAPPLYATVTGGGVLTSYDSNVVTYRLGLGRRFNDTWSGAITVLHEPRSGDLFSNLGPRDGRSGLGVAATWTSGDISVTGGLQYQRLGRANTVAPTSARFSGGSAVAAGLRLTLSF